MAAPNPAIMQAVERLDYRVTVGDVAAQAGLKVNLAQRELLALASEAGGHLQVAESGEIAYLFPRNFRGVLRNKFWQLRIKEWWEKVWRVLFYLIRISFGILLIASILLIVGAIIIILTALNSSRGEDDRDNQSGGGMMFMPNFWFGPNLFWFFDPDPYGQRYRHRDRHSPQANQMNFLEAIFSFLFGDGNPNADLEERRWRTVGAVIRNNGGAVAAEQIAPYLEVPGREVLAEDYMLPVLTRFNGQPEVSPEGEIVYHFPELQSTAAQRQPQSVSAYLRELPRRFSQASSGQVMLAIGLGSVNLIAALILRSLLGDGAIAAQLGGLVAFVQSIFWLLLAYGTAFLAIPLARYFWIQWRNGKIEARNQQRQDRAVQLNQANPALQHKIAYARQFAAETVVSDEDLAYTTEKSLLDQESEHSTTIDAEWQRRLDQSGADPS